MIQRALARPWRWLSEGREAGRGIEALLRAGGFAELTVGRYRIPSVSLPINPARRRQVLRAADLDRVAGLIGDFLTG
ncbi:hypothetical protein AMIS_46140 [Actinoplanes missouriensis 431]|uniref:Uncharacterized protein n=1 Tax=Actinoplanes missouriensis (strain ATCC 14538 / DSM 43046 / CBS 188.64 / JCM 3121 / NBRC 102363 / NCIMB 12654 / NRRL B-3342 / UNCC 431) TaxID=512565 RepID=I0H9Z7_ACTM4|nr:hypothetical protein [Actinoplanes missouriensis]BAL89834.1 hypothetical protein AMIS_46140 [Actinoplanes missouriensis 431]